MCKLQLVNPKEKTKLLKGRLLQLTSITVLSHLLTLEKQAENRPITLLSSKITQVKPITALAKMFFIHKSWNVILIQIVHLQFSKSRFRKRSSANQSTYFTFKIYFLINNIQPYHTQVHVLNCLINVRLKSICIIQLFLSKLYITNNEIWAFITETAVVFHKLFSGFCTATMWGSIKATHTQCMIVSFEQLWAIIYYKMFKRNINKHVIKY